MFVRFPTQTINQLLILTLLVGLTVFPAFPVVSVSADEVEPNATITVNTKADEITTNGKCSLREAITNANNNAATYPDCATGSGVDIITFAGNYTITLVLGQLPVVTSPIIITGKGATNTIIQASTCNPVTLPGGCTPATYRVFQVGTSIGYLTLDSLTVRHGRCISGVGGCSGIGGGIYSIDDSNLTVTNSIISGNYAGSYAGGIYSEHNTVTVTNSTVSGNRATTGGGISSEYGSVTVTNSILSGNSASRSGGGIYTYGSTSSLSIMNSTLSANSAEYGGGILNSSNASLNIAGSTLYDNFAGTGGALYNAGNMWVANSTLSGNQAYDYGGGIYNNGGAWIHNSSIVFNTLIEGTVLGAGGVHGDVALYNSLVAGNTRAISSTYRDCNGTVFLQGGNLFWDTTNCNMVSSNGGYYGILNSLNLLGPLQNNGGPTKTHALLPGSNAIDTGWNSLCAEHDQRGKPRPQDGDGNGVNVCDVGAYEAPAISTIRSNAKQDGWILESSETSNKGGTINSDATTLRLGDDATRKQYRAVLSFNTASLPDDAVITKATLKFKRQGVTGGGNPVYIFQGFMVDIRKGSFGTPALVISDFQANASKTIGPFSPAPSSGWYTLNLNKVRAQVNKTGLTQIRLRFKLDDNNNNVANFLSLHSGNARAADRPQLIVEYYVP